MGRGSCHKTWLQRGWSPEKQVNTAIEMMDFLRYLNKAVWWTDGLSKKMAATPPACERALAGYLPTYANSFIKKGAGAYQNNPVTFFPFKV